MKWLLICVPAALALNFYHANSLLVFFVSLTAIVPLVELMGDTTEELASRFGSTIGGLLNSTLSNAPELIIGIVALSHGLASVVKASLTGSIIANLLLGLGCALLIGGLKYGPQKFEERRLRSNASMLQLCAFCLIVPAVFSIGTPEGTRGLSTEISVVLLVVYLINVLVTLLGGRNEALTPEPKIDKKTGHTATSQPHPVHPKLWILLGTLAMAGGMLALISDALCESLAPTAKALGLSDVFSGVMILGGVGGVGEVLSAIRFARAGKQELVLSATVGSTIQMVLMVAPILVFVGMFMGVEMSLTFTNFEVVAIVLAVVVARELIVDGTVNWMEGVLLLATYVILGFGFYHLPDVRPSTAVVQTGLAP